MHGINGVYPRGSYSTIFQQRQWGWDIFPHRSLPRKTFYRKHCAATFCTIIGPDLSGPFSILENLSDAVALIPNLLPRLTLTQSLLSLPLPSPPSKSAPFPLPQALYCCAALSDGGLPSYLPSCLNRYSRCHIGGKRMTYLQEHSLSMTGMYQRDAVLLLNQEEEEFLGMNIFPIERQSSPSLHPLPPVAPCPSWH